MAKDPYIKRFMDSADVSKVDVELMVIIPPHKPCKKQNLVD